MKAKVFLKIFLFISLLRSSRSTTEGTCSRDESGECGDDDAMKEKARNKYSQESNTKWAHHLAQIEDSIASYKNCDPEKCSCHYPLIKKDLAVFKNGIGKDVLQAARDSFPTMYGIEHFILKVIDKLPDLEMVVNTRDWPQVDYRFGKKLPVFSFSKTSTYLDITYPAWTFWEGGPAIGLYPMGLGRWDLLRKSLRTASEKWPWEVKESKGFFRGSRTSAERDPLVYLSREEPDLVDAQYTKNQAWKSDADTLYAPPASEVPLEDHCQYKYLFNFRGVAASFRFKHLFLCHSLVFHSGDEWIEFFYPRMKPWVHFTKNLRTYPKELLKFAMENDDVAMAIAERGYEFIRDHLRMKDVLCYWRKLLQSYAELLQYKPVKEAGVYEVRPRM
ncbi:LOW QUALITY PROTEIN: O-glucosyltransferase rumi homolog [Penaeus monodon]|uniref:LOW QUALITY PROTEIN: O-glucosyltransferase rumi homolog n=1 Tax=Penaeus monodon TaxID=6687 RepID=UPI0018A72420|nr:LOW QUALITY PROTEIN: O-glucosyltransferase rumi homolog [Penaeus monodon]